MGEPARLNAEPSEPARRRRSTRAVPQDWFMDPVDDDTALAGTGRRGELTALPHEDTDLHRDASAVPGSIWQALAGGYGTDNDEGELAWQTDALCAQTDPEAFFPEKGGSTRDAKRVCGACPVRDECLDYAMDKDEKFGIWGGLSERERRRLRRAGR